MHFPLKIYLLRRATRDKDIMSVLGGTPFLSEPGIT
jgi:hypothetical protein